jgi:acylphosphatase
MDPGTLSRGMQRLEILYRGRVQGVGFRATTREIARRHAVSGWVCNEPDGRVRMEVQGEADEVAALRADIQRSLGAGIKDEQVTEIPIESGERGFEIRYR